VTRAFDSCLTPHLVPQSPVDLAMGDVVLSVVVRGMMPSTWRRGEALSESGNAIRGEGVWMSGGRRLGFLGTSSPCPHLRDVPHAHNGSMEPGGCSGPTGTSNTQSGIRCHLINSTDALGGALCTCTMTSESETWFHCIVELTQWGLDCGHQTVE